MKEPPAPKKTSDFVNAVYYPNWRFYEGQTPASLNLDNVTHLFYAFARYGDHAPYVFDTPHILTLPQQSLGRDGSVIV